MKYQLYNRMIRRVSNNPYVMFNGHRRLLKYLNVHQTIKVGGKLHSVYFYAPIIKGLRIE